MLKLKHFPEFLSFSLAFLLPLIAITSFISLKKLLEFEVKNYQNCEKRKLLLKIFYLVFKLQFIPQTTL